MSMNQSSPSFEEALVALERNVSDAEDSLFRMMAAIKFVSELPGRNLIPEGPVSHRVEALMSLYGRMLAAYQDYVQLSETPN
jgi:hypothetical protein